MLEAGEVLTRQQHNHTKETRSPEQIHFKAEQVFNR